MNSNQPVENSRHSDSSDPRTSESSIAIDILGYLLASVVTGSLLAVIGYELASRFLTTDTDVTDTLTVVLIAVGFGVSIYMPNKALWGYLATALIGVCGVFWYAVTVYGSIAFLFHLFGIELLPGNGFDVDIIFPTWMLIYTVCIPIIQYRHRKEIELPTTLPRFSNLVFHLIGSEFQAFIISLPIMIALGFIAFTSVQIYELITG